MTQEGCRGDPVARASASRGRVQVGRGAPRPAAAPQARRRPSGQGASSPAEGTAAAPRPGPRACRTPPPTPAGSRRPRAVPPRALRPPRVAAPAEPRAHRRGESARSRKPGSAGGAGETRHSPPAARTASGSEVQVSVPAADPRVCI